MSCHVLSYRVWNAMDAMDAVQLIDEYDNSHCCPPTRSVSLLFHFRRAVILRPSRCHHTKSERTRTRTRRPSWHDGLSATSSPKNRSVLYLHYSPIRSATTLNTATPALFLPYRPLQHANAVSNGSTDEWGILEVHSVSPPNQRSWFFTEGEVISGKPH